MSVIVYSALLLNRVGREINQVNITKILKAADAEYEVEDVIKVIDGLQGVDIEKELLKGFTYHMPLEELEEGVPDMVFEEDEEEEPTGIFSLFQ